MNAAIEHNELSEPVIRCDRLTIHAESKTILGNITLDIPRGAVVGVVGRNGAGKSTLLRAMVGLAAPESGTATIFGRPALDMDDGVRARLGYVAQTADLFEWLTVPEHLELLGKAYPKWEKKYCLDLAARFDLPLAGKVSKLSGGDKQKLAVVLALAHRPDVLVLDEPVSHLDPLTRRDFMRALFSDGAGDTTIVISSHLLSDLERVVSHVAFIREGFLQLFDTWDAILEHVRFVPFNMSIADDALVRRGVKHCVVDTRRAPALRDIGQASSLDQLFIALNT
jgi:ABC-2 type transport system ATP-binding protein